MKGPEVAARYPGTARSFGDVDLLVANARDTHLQLREAGFVEVGDPVKFEGIHHLRPLVWPTLPLPVEIHSRPKWPGRLPPPPVEEIVETAVPSALGVPGVLAPCAARHALLIAGHAWAHEPLNRLRDFVDVSATAAEAEPTEIEHIAAAWQALRLWRTTRSVVDALLGQGATPVSLRSWARHLPKVRERTVFESHLQRWLADFWALPLGSALGSGGAAVLSDLLPARGESWRVKIERSMHAVHDARWPLSHHDRVVGEMGERDESVA